MDIYKEIINKVKPEMEKTIAFMESETAKIRTSHASPSLVENVVVDCFGQKLPLKQLSAISTPEPRQILIQPWDKSYLEGIVAALEKTEVGANPVVDKDTVRLTLPPLTEEYRKELLRLLSEKKEHTREILRRWRDRAWDELQEGFRQSKIREDDKFRGKDELQKLVDSYNKKIEELVERKKKEIEL